MRPINYLLIKKEVAMSCGKCGKMKTAKKKVAKKKKK